MEGADVVATDQPPREAAAAVAVTGLGLKAFAQAPAARRLLRRSRQLAPSASSEAALEEYGFDGLAAAGLGNYVASSVTMGLAAHGSRCRTPGTRGRSATR